MMPLLLKYERMLVKVWPFLLHFQSITAHRAIRLSNTPSGLHEIKPHLLQNHVLMTKKKKKKLQPFVTFLGCMLIPMIRMTPIPLKMYSMVKLIRSLKGT